MWFISNSSNERIRWWDLDPSLSRKTQDLRCSHDVGHTMNFIDYYYFGLSSRGIMVLVNYYYQLILLVNVLQLTNFMVSHSHRLSTSIMWAVWYSDCWEGVIKS